MYTFKPVTERVMKYRNKIRDRVLIGDMERARIITESYKKYNEMLPVIKKAKAHYDYCSQCTCFIGDDELIVGARGKSLFASPQYPEWGVSDWIIHPIRNGEWTLEEDGLWHNPPTEPAPQAIAPEDVDYLESIVDFWKDKKCGQMADAWQPDHFEELKRLNVSSYVEGGMGLASLPLGHLVAGYKKIITRGYKSIRDEAQLWLDRHYGKIMGEDVRKYTFYKAAVITCDAAMILARRYGDACKAKADECEDPKRKAELTTMAENLYWLEEHPARTFWQAVQGIMLYQVFYVAETHNPSAAFGRFDQYVWPYLEKDLASGEMTEDFAQEIIDMFFLKANCFYGIAPAIVADTTGVGNTWQHTTLGGVDPITGEDATNPVTYMVLETVGRLELHDPTISLRFNKNSPDKLWDCAIATSKLVGGLPLYQNDEIIVPGLMKELDFSLEDARDYGVIGCQEIVGCGNDYPAPNGAHPPHASVWWAAIMDMAINNGINPFNGEQATVQPGYLYEMNSIEEVRDAFKKMAYHVMFMFASTHNYAEHISQYFCVQPALSISMEGCMEKGADVAWGGCKYNSYGSTATGLATIADSITTIKYMCFDKKLITTRQLYDAVMANWEGYEPLRQQILSEVPHFGNADPYADIELKWVIDLYYEICSHIYSTRSRVYKAGLYGASDHIRQGRINWATPDGRKTGDPIADAISPAQGRDKNGPTAIFCSSQCYDQTRFMDGIALNIRMHPSVVSNQDSIDKLRDMTKAYFENGGMEVQYNVVDTETLRKAQKDPGAYRNLVVRIAGYSAYFVELGVDLQNDIIARNENRV
ncbi:MAG: hypothetical protein IKE57_02110 [Oscillospiraceae bacterium]|nr:hypothetical protein [Oscillospiraceae bacterium]